jgi:hypothetical protein
MLVQYGSHDPLFPFEGKRASAEKIKKVFTKAQVADRMEGKFYDAPHMLSRQMQGDALAWFAKALS